MKLSPFAEKDFSKSFKYWMDLRVKSSFVNHQAFKIVKRLSSLMSSVFLTAVITAAFASLFLSPQDLQVYEQSFSQENSLQDF